MAVPTCEGDEEEETTIVRLRRELDEKTEELKVWKVRCLQAETEVRALKNRVRHVDTAPTPARASQVDGQAPVWASGSSSRKNSPGGTRPDDDDTRAGVKKQWRRQPGDKEGGGQTGIPVRTAMEGAHVAPTNEENAAIAAELARLREEVERLKAPPPTQPASTEIVVEVDVPPPEEVGDPVGDAPPVKLVGTTDAAAATFVDGAKPETTPQSELEELQRLVSHKTLTIAQLQDAMAREKQNLERQRKDAEDRNFFREEELREMTQRAQALSEQVQKSKKKTSQLSAAQAEVASLHRDLEECEARLSGQVDKAESLQRTREEAVLELNGSREEAVQLYQETAAARNELCAEVADRSEEVQALRRRSMTMDSEQSTLECRLEEFSLSATEAKQEHAAVLAKLSEVESAAEVDESGKDLTESSAGDILAKRAVRPWANSMGRQQRIYRCVRSMRQFHLQMRQELRTATPSTSSTGSPVADDSRSNAVDAAVAASPARVEAVTSVVERYMQQMGNQLDRVEQLVDGKFGSHLDGSLGLVPEESSLDEYDNEALRQEVLDYKIGAEVLREELMSEHCDELDDLVRRHDLEKRSWHKDMSELRAECARAEVGGSAARPILEIREHFREQVATVKHELVAQLSDLYERQRQERGDEERELERLQSSLQHCQTELASSEKEVSVLRTLYDSERRDSLRLQQENQALGQRAAAEGEPQPRREALVIPKGSSREEPPHAAQDQSVSGSPPPQMTPDATEMWDSMHTEWDKSGQEDSLRGKPAKIQQAEPAPAANQAGGVNQTPDKALVWWCSLGQGPPPKTQQGDRSSSSTAQPSVMQTPPPGNSAAQRRSGGPPPPSNSSGVASRPSSTGTARASPMASPAMLRRFSNQHAGPQSNAAPSSPTAASRVAQAVHSSPSVTANGAANQNGVAAHNRTARRAPTVPLTQSSRGGISTI